MPRAGKDWREYPSIYHTKPPLTRPYRWIFSPDLSAQIYGISQDLSGLDTAQTYAFSFYYKILGTTGPMSTDYPVVLSATLDDEELFTFAITSLDQRTSTYVEGSKKGIRPRSSTAVLKIGATVPRSTSTRVQMFLDDVSLIQEQPSTITVCSPAAPTATMTI